MIKIQHQSGVVLVVSLIFLMLMTIIGVTAMQGTTQQEKMNNNARQRMLAFQSAEAGLRVAESFLKNLPTDTSFNDSIPGLRSRINPPTDIATYWLDEYNWDRSIVYENSILNKPRYVIERLMQLPTVPTFQGGAPLGGEGGLPRFLYRVTARGTGGVEDVVVILQTIFRS